MAIIGCQDRCQEGCREAANPTDDDRSAWRGEHPGGLIANGRRVIEDDDLPRRGGRHGLDVGTMIVPTSGQAAEMTESEPPGIDPTVPSPARMYDYYLRGKDNYAVDREAAEKALSVVPLGRKIAQANRYFLSRAVLMMAEVGICQFIDLGTGIPTSPSAHEIARTIQPDARVLYVDNDPVVTAHNRALLTKSEGIEAMQGDIREPDTIFTAPEFGQLIDFNQPAGVLFVAVLHFIPDEDDPGGIVRAFTSPLIPGSHLAVSHITSDGTDPDVVAAVEEAYANASAPTVFRTQAEISAFFSGFDLIRPGLQDVTQWFPYAAVFHTEPPALRFLAGVGCKG
jgi:S-adenosyl methyltransferase